MPIFLAADKASVQGMLVAAIPKQGNDGALLRYDRHGGRSADCKRGGRVAHRSRKARMI
jgi:hypothetical protein